MEIATLEETIQSQDTNSSICEQKLEIPNAISDDFVNIKVKQEVLSDDEDVELMELTEDNLIALASSSFNNIKSEVNIKQEEIIIKDECERKIFECPKCKEKFILECLYLFHLIVTHGGTKPFFCTLCRFKVSNRMKFLSHLRKHTNEKKHLCKICGKYYYYWEESEHFQNCPRPIPYHCKECEYCTRKRIEFIVHIRLHTGERPYTCNKCGMGFISPSVLRHHFKSHFGEFYSCHVCDKRFKHPGDRDRHVMAYCNRKCMKCDYISFNCKDYYLHFKKFHYRSKYRQKLDTIFNRLANQLLREKSGSVDPLLTSSKLLQPCDFEEETSGDQDLRGILYSNLTSA